jgi:hypothetical protein
VSKIFCVISNGSLGGTFLDWSVHWLSGEDEFYNVISGWNKLTDNPLTSINAHGHQRNSMPGYSATLLAIDGFNREIASKDYIPVFDMDLDADITGLKSVQTDNTLSVYITANNTNYIIKKLGISKDKTSERSSEIKEYAAEDFKKTWEYCNSNQMPIIYLKLNYPLIYNSEIRTLERSIRSSKMHHNDVQVIHHNTHDDARQEFLNLFFDDADKWMASSTWDKREWIALNIRPFSQIQIDKNVDFSKPHLYLDAQDWWFNGETSIQKIMNYLDITIDPDRWTSWIPVYQQWQKIQYKILRFAWNIDHICDAIVNNHYYDISDYNLDLWHEAIIQHCLLYKYNLNLKSWQLEKFPTNTQDLHKLLESNILHKLDDIYGLLKDR